MGVNMKTLKMDQFDEKDEEIADVLISLGMSRNEAMALSYLQNKNAARSVDLERVARLRQPEVSIAMRQLKERNWIIETEERKPGKGRPNKVYSLKVGFGDIIAHLEKQQRKTVDETQEKLDLLKELGKYKR
jgi:predicted transcriptional regulator